MTALDGDALIELLARHAENLGIEAYLVGGFVRDRLRGHPVKDIDVVAVGDDGRALLAAVARDAGWAPPAVFERFGTAQIRNGDAIIEIVRARAESYAEDSRKPEVRPGTLEEDIWRRDFTVNALCQRFDGTVLDITGHGLDDLRDGVLRTPLEPRTTFSDDPLRMFRCARFVAQLGYTPAPGVMDAMRAEAPRTAILSAERIREELTRLLVSDHPAEGLRVLRDGGLLDEVLPEIAAMAGVQQRGGYHIHDVFEHTVNAVAATPAVLQTRLGALFHDIGKPPTRVEQGERDTFYNHPSVGARMTRAVMERLRFANEQTDATSRLVELHLRPIQYEAEAWSDGAVRRLIRDAGELRQALLDIARADTRASSYPSTAAIDELAERMERLDRDGGITRLRPPLGGERIMALADGRPAGPWVGRVQKALIDAVLDGELEPSDGEAAEEWLRRHPSLLSD